jgi:hypothetical protein
VLATPIKVSQTLLMRYLQACGDLYCSDGTQRAQKKQQAVGVEVEAGARAFVMPPRNESELRARGCGVRACAGMSAGVGRHRPCELLCRTKLLACMCAPCVSACLRTEGCMKLANGHNWRALQPMNSREVKLAT